jgi:cobalt/nickel transport system ATP-binding protein
MESILETRELRYNYPNGPEALGGISLRISRGSKVALVGPNGAGKTTLMLMFNGMLRPTSGDLLFRGVPLDYRAQGLREVRKSIGLVFQHSDAQIFAPTVYQDVAFGPVNLDMPSDQVKAAVSDALAAVGLTGYERRPPHSLSGGEMKRVAIAGILAMDPDVLVFDEPTSSLDPATAEEIIDLLDELNQHGKTIFISTHDVELAYRWADMVVLMEGGRILHQGSPEEVFEDSALLSTARLKQPVVLEIHRELRQRGILPATTPPKGILQFTDIVEASLNHDESGCSPGGIYVCDIDQVGVEEIRQLLATGGIGSLGAMGTRAKQLVRQEEFDAEFTYGVIDKCILKALIGEYSAVLTSGGMVRHVCRRITDYGCESGREIPAILVGPDGRA